MARECSKCYPLLYTTYGKTIKREIKHKGKDQPKGSFQSVSFVLKTDYIHLNTS